MLFLDVQANLPETSPFLTDKMTVLSSFLRVFIVLGMSNCGSSLKTRLKCAANEHFTGEMHQKIPQSHL